MPELDGVEATRRIFAPERAAARRTPVRVVVLTTFNLDDRAATAAPAVVLLGRREQPHVGGALRPGSGQVEMVQDGRPEVALRAVEQVLGGDVAVVAADQRLEVDSGHRRQLMSVSEELLEDG